MSLQVRARTLPCMGWLGRLRQGREDKRVAAEELEAIIRMADEDTTLLGEQLSALGRSTEGTARSRARVSAPRPPCPGA